MVRTALSKQPISCSTRATRFSALKRWAVDVAKRRGMKRAKVALARKLAVVLHRMWVDVTEFRWTKDVVAPARGGRLTGKRSHQAPLLKEVPSRGLEAGQARSGVVLWEESSNSTPFHRSTCQIRSCAWSMMWQLWS